MRIQTTTGWLMMAVLACWLAAAGWSSGADQWFDSGTGSGIDPEYGVALGPGFVWANAPQGSNMWANTSSGTNAPQLWTGGNNAYFTAGGGVSKTVTVNGATANGLTFNASNDKWIFLPGSGPLTINGGIVNLSQNNTLSFFSDLLLGANQTWDLRIVSGSTYASLISTGKVSGVSGNLYQLTKVGAASLTLSNAANQFAGVVVKEGPLAVFNSALGNSNPAFLTLGDTNQFFASKVTIDTAVAGNNTSTIGNLTNAGAAALVLANSAANSTNIIQAQQLARAGHGTLSIGPGAITDLGGKSQVYFTGGTTPVNGILAPWLVASASSGNQAPDFALYSATGIVAAAYETGTWSSASVVNVAWITNGTLSANTNIYALRMNNAGNLTLNPGVTLTLGDGNYAGLSLHGTALLGSGTLAVGAAELIVGVGSSSGTIAPVISGTGGLTVNQLLGGQTLTISNMTYTGDTWINGGTLQVASTNAIVYTNAIRGVGGLTYSGPGALTLAQGPIALGGAITVGNGQNYGNFMTVTNTKFCGNGLNIGQTGSGQHDNNVSVLANVYWDAFGGAINMAGSGGSNNVLLINGGILTNAGATTLGAAGGVGNNISLVISNGGQFYGGAVTLAASNVLFQIGGGGALCIASNSGAINISQLNNGMLLNPKVVVSNALYSSVGLGMDRASGVTMLVATNGTWNGCGQTWNFGYSSALGTGINNRLTIDGGVLTNAGIHMGYGTGASATGAVLAVNNQFAVTNGGRAFLTDLWVGMNGNDYTGRSAFSNNVVSVSGTGSAVSVTSAGSLRIGRDSSAGAGSVNNNVLWIGNGGAVSNSGWVYVGTASSGTATGLVWRNTLIVTNGGKFWSGSTIQIGFCGSANFTSSFNTVQVAGNGALWDMGGQSLNVGNSTGTSTGNVLRVDGCGVVGGAVLTNGYLNDLNGIGNTFIVTNGGIYAVGGNNVNINGINSQAIVVGGGVGGAPSMWDMGGKSLSTSGYTTSTGATIRVDGNGVYGGAVITNIGGLSLSYYLPTATSLEVSNNLMIVNGGQIFTPTLSVGNGTGIQNYNNVTVGGGGQTSLLSCAGALTIGDIASSAYNTMTVSNATVLSGDVKIGENASSNNAATVQAGGAWYVQGSVNGVTVGKNGGTGNVFTVQGGGILEANTLTTQVGAGNTFVNQGGVYQFTNAAPTINAGAGTASVAIASGTVSFRVVTNADVFCNQSTKPLDSTSKMAWSGNNTFQLNNAINLAAGQGYTFQTGTATNFANLSLLNNATYRGGAVTIGSGGSLMIGAGTSTIASNLTFLPGSTFVVSINGTNSFSQLIVQGATLSLAGSLQVNLASSLPKDGASFQIVSTPGATTTSGAFTNTSVTSSYLGTNYTMTVSKSTSGVTLKYAGKSKGTAILFQ